MKKTKILPFCTIRVLPAWEKRAAWTFNLEHRYLLFLFPAIKANPDSERWRNRCQDIPSPR